MTTPAPFPHHYDMELRGTGDDVLLSSGDRDMLVGGPPPEFGGKADRWSPEHLLLASLNLCVETTFAALARRARLDVVSYRSRATTALDRTDAGIAFTGFDVHVVLHVAPPDVARARELMDKAKKHCLVSNALRAPVELRLDFTT